jgi:hypothetical protein
VAVGVVGCAVALAEGVDCTFISLKFFLAILYMHLEDDLELKGVIRWRGREGRMASYSEDQQKCSHSCYHRTDERACLARRWDRCR